MKRALVAMLVALFACTGVGGGEATLTQASSPSSGQPESTAPQPEPFELSRDSLMATAERLVAALNAGEGRVVSALIAPSQRGFLMNDCDYKRREYSQADDRAEVAEMVDALAGRGTEFELEGVEIGDWRQKPGEAPTVMGLDLIRRGPGLPSDRIRIGVKLPVVSQGDGTALFGGFGLTASWICRQGVEAALEG